VTDSFLAPYKYYYLLITYLFIEYECLLCVLFADIAKATGISAGDIVTTLRLLKLIDTNEEDPDVG